MGGERAPQDKKEKLKGLASRLRCLLEAVGLAPLLVVYCGIALWHLNCLPFWIDEAIAVFPAKAVAETGLPYGDFDLEFMPWQVQDRLWDPATPFYRFALGLWFYLFGFSEITARGFSLFFGGGVLLVIFYWVRRNFSFNWSFAALLLFLSSPTYLSYAREARHFTFLLFWGSLSLFTLTRALHHGSSRAFLASFLFLVLTLLTQVMGMIFVVIYGAYFLFWGFMHRSLPPCTRRELLWILGLGGTVAFLILVYLPSYPLVHDVNCTTRPFDCHPQWDYYLAVLLEFLSGRSLITTDYAFSFGFPSPLGLGLLLVITGLLRLFFAKEERSFFAPFLLWAGIPLFLLSFAEIKFPRYLFETSFPAWVILELLGIYALSRLKPLSLWSGVGIFITLLQLTQPYLGSDPVRSGVEKGSKRASLRFALFDYLQKEVVSTPLEHFESTRFFVRYLKEHANFSRDKIITNFNDPALQYYLGVRVYGMITTKQNDDSFLRLLETTRKQKGRLFILLQGPDGPFCYTDRSALEPLPCSRRYPRFLKKCQSVPKDCIFVTNPFQPGKIPRYSKAKRFCPWLKEPN